MRLPLFYIDCGKANAQTKVGSHLCFFENNEVLFIAERRTPSMEDFSERRSYQRCDNTICKAMLSLDEIRWDSFEVNDISAGGLSFVSGRYLEQEAKLFFNIYVYNMLSEFNLKLEGHIIRMSRNGGVYSYAIKFDNVDKYTQVQLDELVKSKITLTNTHEPAIDDGTYSFLLMPRSKSKRISMHL